MSSNTVLYVEDEEDYQILVRRILGKEGFQIQVAYSGEEGLRALEEIRPSLLILDVNLPDTDGYALCRLLRKHPKWVSLPVLMLTVRRRPEEWLQGFAAGADDYVSKPLNPPELVERVRSCLVVKTPEVREPATDPYRAEFLLVRAAVAGNRTAFEVLIRKYKQRLLDSLYASGRSAADAEDIAATAFSKAYQRLRQFRGQSSFYTWLYRIAFNAHTKRRHLEETSWEGMVGRDSITLPHFVEPDQAGVGLSKRILHAQIHQAVAVVPKPYRQMLKWHFVRGLSYETMARRLKIPRGTVMSRLFRARQLLRKSWARQGT